MKVVSLEIRTDTAVYYDSISMWNDAHFARIINSNGNADKPEFYSQPCRNELTKDCISLLCFNSKTRTLYWVSHEILPIAIDMGNE